MCFSPSISLGTALFEFLTAAFVLMKMRRRPEKYFIALFLTLLGAYQLTEYSFCASGNKPFWAIGGFLVYTFLPPLGLHFITKSARIKVNPILWYLPAIGFSILALTASPFFYDGSCNRVFVFIRHIFFPWPELTSSSGAYWFYYLSYVFLAALLLVIFAIKDKEKDKRYLYWQLLSPTILAIVPALILFGLAPSLRMVFPSMYCLFAAVYAVFVLWLVHKESKRKAF
ncbi:hypothetical protein HYV84_02865 [Candidatus Woesearchaeota archaeon]|nr:hypothetical protein [Candidatus Woesearchaeota archaeon]